MRRPLRWLCTGPLAAAALALAGALTRPATAIADPIVDAEDPPPVIAATGGTADGSDRMRFFPLPMYTTVPNEGSTYGLMPVFLVVSPAGAMSAIAAPSVSWNSAAGVNGTVRFYRYPTPDAALSIVGAASTHTNRTLRLTYDNLPRTAGHITIEALVLIRRSLFYRYFGLGPDTSADGESSYTRTTAFVGARLGVNLAHHLNVGLRLVGRADRLERHAIFGLPATQDLYPDAPGLDGAALAAAEASLRYDTRPEGDYSARGLASEVTAAYQKGLGGVGDFVRVGWHTRGLWPETRWLQGAARLYATWVPSTEKIPFYYQSALGGENLFRGFHEDRFIDLGAWEVELEQRIRVMELRWFGVVTDWRVDPFVAAGQVFHDPSGLATHVRGAVGLGLRVWVKPNVLGRVDVAYSSEGPTAYVVLGYPF